MHFWFATVAATAGEILISNLFDCGDGNQEFTDLYLDAHGRGKNSMKNLRRLCNDLAAAVQDVSGTNPDLLSQRLDIDLQAADVKAIRAGLTIITGAKLRADDIMINVVASDDKTSEIVIVFEKQKPDVNLAGVDALDPVLTKQYSSTGKGYAILYRINGALITITVSTPANTIDSVSAERVRNS